LLIILWLFSIFTSQLFAQVPQVINYQGILKDANTGTLISGNYSMTFTIYDSQENVQWTETQTVTVDNGHFNALLGSSTSISPSLFNSGGDLFLGIKVENDPEMTPRKPLTSVGYAMMAANAAKLNGKDASEFLTTPMTGNSSEPILSVTNIGYNSTSIYGESQGEGGQAVFGKATSTTAEGVLGVAEGTNGRGVYGISTNIGVEGDGQNNIGVLGKSTNSDGVVGETLAADKSGVRGYSADGYGVKGESISNYGVVGMSTNSYCGLFQGKHGIRTATTDLGNFAAWFDNIVRITRSGQHGIQIDNTTWAGVWVNTSGYDAFAVTTAGRDGLNIESAGRDYIRAGQSTDLDFRVTNDGTAYADGGWQGAADFAELIEVDGDILDYEPGDVLVICQGRNRSVTLSSQPYSTSVIGIYSTKPGFVGSTHPMEDKYQNEIPVAITGIVPCKVSTENGPIHNGDLLTTSNTPGYAMKATEPKIGTVVGKALESLESGTGKIEVLVILQ